MSPIIVIMALTGLAVAAAIFFPEMLQKHRLAKAIAAWLARCQQLEAEFPFCAADYEKAI